jgi:hypothetical protein
VKIPVHLLPGIAVAVAEEEDFDLGAAEDLQPLCLGSLDLPLQDLAGGDPDGLVAVLLHRVAEHERRAVEPRHETQRRPVGDHLEVLESTLPVGERESRLRIHVHVHGEQVVGGVQPLAVQQPAARAGGDALAHEASPEIGEGTDDRVDAPRAEQILELFGVNMAVCLDLQPGLPAL